MTAICILASLSFLLLRKPYAHKNNALNTLPLSDMTPMERNKQNVSNLNQSETVQRLTMELSKEEELATQDGEN